MESIIVTRGLRKDFGPVKAVQGIDLEVRRGEIYGFLGRNGAGKTTTIRILLGLMGPTAGEVEIFGKGLATDRAYILGRLGYFVEGASAYPALTVRENLEIQRRLTASPRGAVERVLDLLGLGEYADRKAGRLSLGNKQRLSLARALLHRPELIILDEPANGLDPAGIVEVRRLLLSLAKEEGTTIFMSSHILGEVEQLADRIGIIHRGLLLEELDREALSAKRRHRLELGVSDRGLARRLLKEGLGLEAEEEGGQVLAITDPGADPAAVARLLVGAGLSLTRLVAVEEDLESHFMALTGGGE